MLTFDRATATPLELLRFKAELSASTAFEAGLRERIEQTQVEDAALAPARSVERWDNALLLISRHAGGRRLSEIVSEDRGPSFALEFICQVAPALAALSDGTRRFAHGALSVDRVVVGRDGRFTVMEHPLGAGVEALGWPGFRLQSELGLVMPEGRKSNQFDARVDPIQLAFVTLSILLGRRIDAVSYPADVTRLLDESAEAKGGETWAASRLRSWLERALQVGPRPLESAREALNSLGELPSEMDFQQVLSPTTASAAAAVAKKKDGPQAVAPKPTAVATPAVLPHSPAPAPAAPVVLPQPIAPAAQVALPQPIASTVQVALPKPAAPPVQVVSAQPPAPVAQVASAKPVESSRPAAPAVSPAPAPSAPTLVARPAPPPPTPIARPAPPPPALVARPLTPPPSPKPQDTPAPLVSDKRPPGRSVRSWALAAVSVVALVESVVIGRRYLFPPKPAAVEAARPAPAPAPAPALVAAVEPPAAKPAPERKVSNPPPGPAAEAPAPRPSVPPAPPPAAAAAATVAGHRFGGVTISSPLDLQVFEGSTRLGSSGAPIALEEGVHAIDLVNDALGFRVRQTIAVKPGELTSRVVAVPNGRVSINAAPWADVLIDGNPAGQTPLANLSLPIGEHQITFRHPQLGEQRQTAVVKSEGVTRLSANMQR